MSGLGSPNWRCNWTIKRSCFCQCMPSTSWQNRYRGMLSKSGWAYQQIWAIREPRGVTRRRQCSMSHRRGTKAGGLSLRCGRIAAQSTYRQFVFEPGFHIGRTLAKQVSPFIQAGNQTQHPRSKRHLPYWSTAYTPLIKINNRTAYFNYSNHAANLLPTTRTAHSKVLLIFAGACL